MASMAEIENLVIDRFRESGLLPDDRIALDATNTEAAFDPPSGDPSDPGYDPDSLVWARPMVKMTSAKQMGLRRGSKSRWWMMVVIQLFFPIGQRADLQESLPQSIRALYQRQDLSGTGFKVRFKEVEEFPINDQELSPGWYQVNMVADCWSNVPVS